MSEFRIEKDDGRRLEIGWDVLVEVGKPDEAGIYVLIHDDQALTDQLSVAIGDVVVHKSEHIAATGCIRLSLDDARRTRDALDVAITEAIASVAKSNAV